MKAAIPINRRRWEVYFIIFLLKKIIKYYIIIIIMSKGIYINDSVHGLIRLSELEKDIISSIGFNRLHDIYQNSTVYLTYPSNRTKRFEHSIGTMKLCSDMFFYAISNSSEINLKRFYTLYKDAIDNLIEDFKKNQLKEYEPFLNSTPTGIPKVVLDDFHKSLISFNVSPKFRDLHILLMQSVRVAALLHDIGHPPFSHVVEFALKDSKIKHSQKASAKRQKEFSKEMNMFSNESALHEMMGRTITQDILQTIIKKGEKKTSDPEIFFEILVAKCVEKIYDDDGVFSYLHRLIDGTLDGDRLDYVTRDPFNSGLNVGCIDYSRITREMKILYSQDPKTGEDLPVFCIPVKSVNTVEDFLRRRYDLYKNIINHHRVIKTDFLLKNTVENLISKYLDDKSKQKNENNKSVIPFDISGLWFPLKPGILKERNSALAQWNDSWLVTILKQIYYKEYHNKNFSGGTSEYLISKQLAELLENRKNYYSLIKRSEDFRVIDNALAYKIKESSDNIENMISNLEIVSKERTNADTPNLIDEAGTLSYIRDFVKNCKKKKCDFLLAGLLQNGKVIQLDDIDSKIKAVVENEIKKSNSLDVSDIITVFKPISIGIGDPVYFYDANDKLYTMDEISGIATALRNENLFRPVFYVYILTDNSKEKIISSKGNLLKTIGSAIGSIFVEHFCSVIKKQMDEFNRQKT